VIADRGKGTLATKPKEREKVVIGMWNLIKAGKSLSREKMGKSYTPKEKERGKKVSLLALFG